MRTLIDMFLEQVGRNSERVAVMDCHGAYTYGQLNRRSAILAKHLLDKQQGLKTEGKRIAVLLPRSRDFLVAMLGILRAGCAAVPMDSEYPAERINTILEDAGCSLCISVEELSTKVKAASVLDLDGMFQENEAVDESLNLSDPDVEGLLLFTSGSTGKPKGVVHRQSIFSYGLDVLRGYHESTEKDIICCMVGLTFVASMIDLYPPLMTGGSIYIADEAERRNVNLLYKTVIEQRVTGMYLPPQMFEVMRDLYGPLPLAYIVLGGEKVKTKYAGDGNLVEFYGSTETAVVLAHRITAENPRMLGKPCGGAEVYLLSESGERITEPEVVGEFCVAGPYVAEGYNNLPEETAAKFTENPFKTEGGRLYHSGDYMAFDEEGNLIFHGRKDRMVKLRGYRVELGEIETAMLRAEGVSEAACVLTKVHGGDKLCCYYTGEKAPEASVLSSHVKHILPEYMVPDYFVCLESLPRNERNKVNYLALQELVPPVEEEEYIPPQNETEERVCAAFADVLKLPRVSATADFFDMGGTSLSASLLIAKFGEISLSFGDVTGHPTPRALAEYIQHKGQDSYAKPQMDREFYPLTKTQMGIYLEASTGGNNATYTLSYLMKADADVTAEELAAVVQQVVAAHPSMKYVIREDAEGIPAMFLSPEAPVEIPVIDGTAENRLDFVGSFMPVVPMTESLLFHFAVYRTPENCYLAMKSHLIFFDATSLNLLINELNRALGGRPLQREEYNIQQAGMREERLVLEGMHEKAEHYFANLFRDMEEIPSLQGDLNAPLTPGVSENLRYEPKTLAVSQVKAFCDRCRISESSFFLGAMALLLGKYLSSKQVSFSTVYNGRAMSELAGTFGTLIKRIPVYGDLRENVPITDYLKSMGQQIIASMGNDIYSFDEALKHCPVNEDVEFIYQGDLFTDKMGGEEEDRRIEGDAYFMEHYHTGMVTGCMSIQFFATQGLYNVTIEYRNERFSPGWVRQFAQGLFTICQGFLAHERIGDISLLTEKDREQLATFNDTRVIMEFVPVHEQIRRHAQANPDQKAVTAKGKTLTFRELDELSDRAAYALCQKGVKKDTLVGVLFDREVWAYVAELAILKAGGAFVPFIPEYPDERIDFCLQDGNIPILLTSKDFLGARSGLAKSCQVIALEDMIASPAPALGLPNVKPDNLAYCIYTSGTTGTPKGVMIEHKNIANYVHRNEKSLEIMHYAVPGRVALALASFSFDVSVVEEFVPLCNGCQVVIATEEEIHDPFKLAGLIEGNEVNGITCTPTYLLGLLDIPEAREVLKRISFFDVGAEAFPAQLYQRLRELRADSVILNVYGPTEATMGCAAEEMTGAEMVTVGRPIANTKFFLLDSFGHELPVGVRGELIICGDQVGRGYVNLPEKTAESFFVHEGLPAYRSGDLAAWTSDGKIRIFGRLDNQIKLRGFRIELDEIEQVMAGCPGVKSGAVNVVKKGTAEYLAAYYTSQEVIAADDLKAYMQEKLPEYMLPSVFVRLEAMPMTPGGKVDRKALPEAELRGEYVEPATEAERMVAACIQKTLKSDAPVGATDDFFALGGDSIQAIRLTSLLREQGISVKAHEIFKLRTVQKIAAVCKSGEGAEISQEPFAGQVEDTAIFGLYKHLELPEKHYFNQSTLLKCKVKLSLAALQEALDKLTFQHDMLRAVIQDEHLFVRPAGTKICIEEYSLPDDKKEDIAALCEDIQSHLDIEESLLRAALIHAGGRQDGGRDLFFLTAHHTIIDGVSWRILLADLETALRGESLPKKTHTYQDYALAMKEYRDSYPLEQEIPYWKHVERKLLATDTSDCKDYTRHFSELHITMDKEGTAKFLAAKLGAYHLEVNDLLLAAVGESYRRTFGKTSLSIQLEGHGREYLGKDLVTDRTVGWFTSLYPVVLEEISGEPEKDLISVKETLRRVPNKGVGYNILAFVEGKRPLTLEINRIAKMVFNYLGNVSGEAEGGDYFAPDVEDGFSSGLDYQSAKNCEGSDLNVNCLIDEGKFSLWLTYNLGRIGEQEAADFAKGILSRLEVLADHLDTAEERVTASDLGETEWTTAEFDHITEEFARRGEHLERIYPLTPLQEGMLLEHVSRPHSPAYRLVDICELDFLPEEGELRLAIDAVAKKHEVLRTAIIHEGVSSYRQAVTDRKLSLTMMDLSAKADKLAAAKEIRKELLASAFDLQNKPLIQFICAKTSETSCYILVASHHIIVDGWCSHIYLADFAAFLQEAHDQGRISSSCEGEKGRYEAAVREIIAKDKNPAAKYFSTLLEGYENKAEIPYYGTIPEEERYVDDQIVEVIDKDTVKNLEEICRQAGATLVSGIELVWGMVLQTVCRLEDVVFAKVVSGRDKTAVDVSELVGLFINTVPVRVKTDKDSTAAEMLGKLNRQATETSEFDFCPLTDIQKAAGIREGLFYSIISVENYTGEEENNSPLKSVYFKEENLGNLGIDAASCPDGSLRMVFSFDPKRYREAEVRRIIALTRSFMENIAKSPAQALRSLPLLNESDEREMILLSQGEKLDYDTSKTWLDLFLNHVKKDSGKTAVVDSKGAFTYGELERASDSIAAWLLENGVTAGDFVALKMGRVKEFLAAVIAVQKVGAAYVPIDPEYPEERIRYMLEDSEAKAVLTEETAREAMAKFPDAAPMNLAVPEGRAYMIYTSGSTGRPKGVVQSHRSLRALVAWMNEKFAITEKSVHVEHPSFSFDASLMDLFCPLSVGGTIHICSDELIRDMANLQEYMVRHCVSMATFSTQIGMLLVNQYPDLPLRYLMMGGEKLLPCKKTAIGLINGYGPTEFTVCSSYHVVDQEVDKDIPIGRPVPNTWSFICDSYGHLLPQGVMGELCLAGNQLAEGYWKKPELTAKSFVECSFLPGQKMYRTGDLARYNEDGELEYLGRIDNQVKLRGFRIEMGEIESRAAQFEGIEYVAAAVKKEQLILYYTGTDGAVIDREELRRFLAESLTDYMVPTVYMPLAAMPMTPNGKINRKALPEPERKERVIDPPENELQVLLCGFYRKALDLTEVGVNEDFFALGGNSLKAAQVLMAARLKELPLTYQDIFDGKTVAGLEAAIERKRKEEDVPSAPKAAEPTEAELAALAHNRNEYVDEIGSGSLGGVLLTGATGFLGVHVLRYLLEHTEEKIYCLLRSHGKDVRQKLMNLLFYYFENDYAEEFDRRLFALEGDITDSRSLERTAGLDYHTVINCAASVKHFADMEFLKAVNVHGVENLTRLCLEKGSRLVQISTTSVKGEALDGLKPGQRLRENSLDIGQNVESNAYVYTKYLAEKHVLTSIEEQGLDGKVIRVGNLSSRVRDGEFQINFSTNAFMNTLRAYAVLGCYPFAGMSEDVELSYIDETARAVVLLSGIGRDFTVFHAYNGYTVKMGDIIAAMNHCGIPVECVVMEEFKKRLREGLAREDINGYLSVLIRYDQEDAGKLEVIPTDNRFTLNALYRLGFHWTITDMTIIEQMLGALKTLGFFDCATDSQTR